MRNCCGFVIVAAVVFGFGSALAEGGQPLRGIELDPRAPERVVACFGDSGLNTVVVPFRRQGDLEDKAFQESLARWGALAKKRGMRCLIAVRLFGPSEYTGCTGSFRRGKEAIAGGSPCVCPAEVAYWAEFAAPRAQRVSELAAANGLSGVLFEFSPTLSGHEYNANFCFCGACWKRFVQEECNGDEDLLALDFRKCVEWIRTSGRGSAYYACLARVPQEQMRKAAQAALEAFPEMEMGIYNYWDAWFHHAISRGMSEAGLRPHLALAEYEKQSVGAFRHLLERRWEEAGLDANPTSVLPADYYLPRDVQNQIAALGSSGHGFLLTATNSLWNQVEDYFHIYPAHGASESFAQAIKRGLSGDCEGKPVLFNEAQERQPLPHLALIHGGGATGTLSKLVVRMAEAYQLPCSRLNAKQLGEWVHTLSAFQVAVLLPGVGAASPEAFAEAAPHFKRYLDNGGILLALSAADEKQLGWLAACDDRFALEGDHQFGLKQAWLDTETGIMTDPITVGALNPMMMHFKRHADAYVPLAKDGQDCAYVVMQHVGRGMLLATAGPTVSTELIANAWFHFRRRGESVNIGLIPGAARIHFGKNALVLGAAEFAERANNVDVAVDVVDASGKTETHVLEDVSVAGDGIRVPLDYVAGAEGAGRVVVTLSDPADGALIRRAFIDIIHDQRVEALPDKNYYTDESEAQLRVTYFDTALMNASAQMAVDGSTLEFASSGTNPQFVSVPLAGLSPGEHELSLSFEQEGAAPYVTTALLRVEKPYPNPVKVLFHRSCVLEVAGKPFFPLGCYGIEADQAEELVALGVNTVVGGDPGGDGKLKVLTHDLRKWAFDESLTADKLRERLRGPDFANLLAYYMYDEPALWNQTPELLMRGYIAGRAKDPYHPQMSVYIGSLTYPLYPDYVPSGDCQMMDHYPLPYYEVEQLGAFLSKLADVCRDRVTVWSVPQCFDWREIGTAFGPYDTATLHPRGEEARNYVYQSIVAGAGAITFWTYRFAAEDPPRGEKLKAALAEGSKIAHIVANGTVVPSPETKPFGARIRCRSFQVDNKTYVVAVNPTRREVAVEFRAPYLDGKKLKRWLPEPADLAGCSDTFGPLESKVYLAEGT